jgi:hypothetical protein
VRLSRDFCDYRNLAVLNGPAGKNRDSDQSARRKALGVTLVALRKLAVKAEGV